MIGTDFQISAENFHDKFGEPDSIIEIDESCFFERKNGQGRDKNKCGLSVCGKSLWKLFVQ